MSEHLKELLQRRVSVITRDGRNYVGTLRGVDKTINLVLEDCQERVFAEDKPVEVVAIGLFIIRGDNT